MAAKTNLEETIVQQGRFNAQPRRVWPQTTVANINFEELAYAIRSILIDCLQDYEPLRIHFSGTSDEIDAAIQAGITDLTTQALLELWNRLRILAETHHRQTRNDRFPRKAPGFEGFQLPRFLANMLSGIGPLRIEESLMDTTIIYAPPQALRDNFGFGAAPNVNGRLLNRIIKALNDSHIPMGSINTRGSTGAFFTTCHVDQTDPNVFEVIGWFPKHHYTRTDAVTAMMFGTPLDRASPFQDVSITLSHVTNANFLTHLRNNNPPDADEARPAGDSRPVYGTFSIQYNGLAPASDLPVANRAQGCYVLGRGYERFSTVSLARRVTEVERVTMLKERLLTAPQSTELTEPSHKRKASTPVRSEVNSSPPPAEDAPVA